jgi:hypothetical protein
MTMRFTITHGAAELNYHPFCLRLLLQARNDDDDYCHRGDVQSVVSDSAECCRRER